MTAVDDGKAGISTWSQATQFCLVRGKLHRLQPDLQGAAAGHRVLGIGHQVEQHLVQLALGTRRMHRLARQDDFETDGRAENAAHHVRPLVNGCSDVNLRVPGTPLAPEGHEVRGQFAGLT